eukprot:scaffold28_cov515-Prasinococcus_capsulatus_cf.AAC.23
MRCGACRPVAGLSQERAAACGRQAGLASGEGRACGAAGTVRAHGEAAAQARRRVSPALRSVSVERRQQSPLSRLNQPPCQCYCTAEKLKRVADDQKLRQQAEEETVNHLCAQLSELQVKVWRPAPSFDSLPATAGTCHSLRSAAADPTDVAIITGGARDKGEGASAVSPAGAPAAGAAALAA